MSPPYSCALPRQTALLIALSFARALATLARGVVVSGAS